MKKWEGKLMEAMEESDPPVEAFKLSDGTMISKRNYFSISATKDNREMTREWLMEHYGDDSDFIVETVNKEALTDLIKQEIESKEKYAVEFPDFLKLKTGQGIVVHGWKERSP